jgi:eukaryotic-like serine/threonine-protein kinase
MSTESQPLPPKKLGKYEIRREVGRGGMGVVYEGYDPLIHRRVALKTLISELFTGPQADTYLTRLQREAQAAGRLSHPNIVAVYDYGEEALADPEHVGARMAFIAMEFVEGRELSSYLSAAERFSTASITRIMSELLDALEYSHKHGVVHRDIKPSNIILLADGTVKVADFGIARIESSTLTQVGTVMGSPSYMSPEQFLAQTVDGRSDLYSAGVVLYELLTGEVPFTGSFSNIMHRVLNEEPSPPSVLNVHLPKSIDAVLRRAMAKRPAERYQSAAEFKQAILAEFSGAAAGAIADPTQSTAIRPQSAIGASVAAAAPARGSRQGVMIIAACVLAGAAAGAYLLWGSRLSVPTPAASSAGVTAAPEPSRAAALAAPPPAAPLQAGTAIISAVGLADPNDPRFAKAAPEIERSVWGDARRQLIAKAVALYVDPSSISTNYAILRDKVLSRSDQYIATVLEQSAPQTSPYGLVSGTMRATVKVRDVQKSLNQISRDDRVDFIRNHGDPRIAVDIRAQSAAGDPAPAPQRSSIAENILTERIRSFGFVVVDRELAKPPPDFLLDGEVRFKRLSARLPASGLTIEKFVLTSWTVRAVDTKTGEQVYYNTKIPDKQSWASEELALQDVGRLIGAEFSKDFFLQYFDFGTKRVRLRFSGLPAAASGAVFAEVNATLRVLNATPVEQSGGDVVIDTDLSGGSDAASALIQDSLLAPLNRKLAKTCFSLRSVASDEVRIGFDVACTTTAMLDRLETAPPEALMDAPTLRIEDVVQDPNRLRRTVL